MGAVRAWVVSEPSPIHSRPLRAVERADPEPGPGEVRVRVRACGVCRTDLHLAEGDLPPRRPATVPGHEIVGTVDPRGAEATRFDLGDRIGIAWLRDTCGRCRWCRTGRENLCPAARFTGWDADGGYAEHAVVPEAYAYRLPPALDDVHAAPLLCAGIVGYRALRRADLPPAGRLGIYGFGASAHVVAQVAIAQGAAVHVLTRSATARELALDLGAASAGPADAGPPELLDAAVLFAPAGELCRWRCGRWTRVGRSPWPASTSPTFPGWTTSASSSGRSNCAASPPTPGPTGTSSCSSRPLSGSAPTVDPRPLDEADQVLADLAADRITGAAVLVA